MNRICRLFDVPAEVAFSSSQQQILVSPLYTAALSKGGKLSIFSNSLKSMVGSFDKISCIRWIDLGFIESQVLAVLSDGKISLLSFSSTLPQGRAFDESKQISPFSVSRVNENILKICEFEPDFRVVSFVPFTPGSLVVRDADGQLQKLVFFPDGVYKGTSVSARECERFTWTGLYLAGASATEVHVWTSGMEHVWSGDFSSAELCAIGLAKVGVIGERSLTIIDVAAGRTSQALLEKKVSFVAMEGNEVVYPPEKTIVGLDSPFFPLFVGERCVFTIDSPNIHRVLSMFPIGIGISVLEGKRGVEGARAFIAEHAVETGNVGLVREFLETQGTASCLEFIKNLERVIVERSEVGFARLAYATVASFCIRKIASSNYADEFSELLIRLKEFVRPVQQCVVKKCQEETESVQKISEAQVREYVQKSLRENQITRSLFVLRESFPEYPPFSLFKKLVLQEAWCLVCEHKIDDAKRVLQEFGEEPMECLYQMWRQTTRKGTREELTKYLGDRLSQQDKENLETLRRLAEKKEKRQSFGTLFQSQIEPKRAEGGAGAQTEKWQPERPLDQIFQEQESMLFGSQFQIPEEPQRPLSEYFVGSVAVIEASREKLRDKDMERLWRLHSDVLQFDKLKEEFRANLENGRRGLCESFLNTYYGQMNVCEREPLANMLCELGIVVDFEREVPEHFVARICKNGKLFDANWWKQHPELLKDFTISFAKFCGERSLLGPFELFIAEHGDIEGLDLREVGPLKFILDLWKANDISRAALSWAQYQAKSTSEDFTELWRNLDDKSMAPLASYLWNKNPKKFQPGSPETQMLSTCFLKSYPFLASLVTGKLPATAVRTQPLDSCWRSPMWTSKYDLELHDMIQERFSQYDFRPIFTDWYATKSPDQPKFPNFEHPDLVNEPTAIPYLPYIKCKVPVSTFKLAMDNGLDEEGFKSLCLGCLKEAFGNRDIRLSALSFIELVDLKFGSSMAVDYKLCLAIYDKLFSADNDTLIYKLTVIFTRKDKDAAQMLEKKLMPDTPELYLICALLRVRCDLALDYTPVTKFAASGDTHELLLFIDRAAELGAHYSITDVVTIAPDRMPESNLKAHLLFHLSHSLPTEAGPTSAETPPALVAFRAETGNADTVVTLLQEALNRKDQVYGFLATSVEGADLVLCAYVIMLTLSNTQESFDVAMYSECSVMADMFIETLEKLLYQNKSLELMQALEVFGKDSIAVQIVFFYRAVELFAFRRAESVLADVKALINGKTEIHDRLLGEVQVSIVTDALFRMMESLAKACAEKSQIHVFRFLDLLSEPLIPPSLSSRVKLCRILSGFENFKRAIVCSNLLGDEQQIVSDLVLNHSLALGKAAAECFGIPSDRATEQWLAFKYSTASTPAQVLEIHNEVVELVTTSDSMFFVCVFASLLPYAQATFLMPILEYARKILTDETSFSKKLDALLLHLKLCKQNNISAVQGTGGLPSLTDLFAVLFPGVTPPNFAQAVVPKITSNVLFGLDTIQLFFTTSVDEVIDMCIERQQVENAYLIGEWRNQDPRNIAILETIHLALTGQPLTHEQEEILRPFGDRSNMQDLLDSIAKTVGWRFVLLSLHHRASILLGVPTSNLLQRKTSEFIESPLSVTTDQWDLVRELIEASQMSANEVASKLAASFVDHVKKVISMGVPARSNQLAIDDYGEQYLEFTKLCTCPNAVGDKLFDIVRKNRQDLPLAVTVNLLLHASLCTSDIDECADLCDALLDALTNENQLDLVMELVCIFPEPALLPRFFQYLIAQQKLDELPPSKLNEKVGRVIMNCARHVHPFEPQNYFDLTLKYNLRRDHAELQMQCGLRLLVGNPDSLKLHDASRHFLLALAYFLQEKCYSLAMECLKKLSLISLQMEMAEPQILHLESQEVLQLMCQKDFPSALTLAVAYDMDTEENWAEAIYEQTVVGTGDEFLATFQFYRPITSELCDGVMRKYQAGKPDDEQRNRMKLFINNIPSLVERYRIAKSLEFTDQIESMKQGYPVVCEWCERACIGQR